MAKRKSEKKKRGLIAALFIAVFMMAVGYAVYSSDLVMNAVGKIYSDWDLRFSALTVGSKTTDAVGLVTGTTLYATNGIVPSTTPDDGKGGLSLTFETELTYTDDYVIYAITIDNYSEKWDALLDEIDYTNAATDFIHYSFWKDAAASVTPFAAGEVIDAEDSLTIYVKAFWNPSKLTDVPTGAIKKGTDIDEDTLTYSEEQTITLTWSAQQP